jgi:hypothetical protein
MSGPGSNRDCVDHAAAMRQLGMRIVKVSGATVHACGGSGDAFHPNDVPGLIEDIVTMLVRAAKGDPCRRCSECEGQHHWMCNGVELRDPGGDEGPATLVMECKHCDAIRKATDGDIENG